MWESITVGKFQQLHDILAGQTFENDVERRIHVLACLEGKQPDDYEDVVVNDLRELLKKTYFLSTEEVPVVKAPKEIEINGVQYRIMYDFTKLTAGQLIDALNETKAQNEHIMRMHRILAAISVPKGQKYGDTDFSEVADAMLQAPIIEAQAIALFFCSVWNKFLNAIPGYLLKKVRKQKKGNWKELEKQLLALSQRVGAGLNLEPK